MIARACRILVVDDDAFFHNVVRIALQDNMPKPYVIYNAYNGVEAKKQFQLYHPDIVLTDILMPDMDGFELTLYLKQVCPKTYVVAISGTNQDNLDIACQLGTDFALDKDHLFEKLPNAIEAFQEVNQA